MSEILKLKNNPSYELNISLNSMRRVEDSIIELYDLIGQGTGSVSWPNIKGNPEDNPSLVGLIDDEISEQSNLNGLISRKINIDDFGCSAIYQWRGDTSNKLWLVTDYAETIVGGTYHSEGDCTEYFYPFAVEESSANATVYFIESKEYKDKDINPYYKDNINTMSEWIRYVDKKNIVNNRTGGEFRVVDDSMNQRTVAKYGDSVRHVSLMDIKVGDDLSGATIHFNPNNLPIVLASDAGLSGFQWVIWTPYGGINFGVIWNGSFIQDSSMSYIYQSIPDDLQTPNWLKDSFTFPDGAIVESIYDLNGNRKTWDDFEIAMADTSWKPSMATVDIYSPAIALGDSSIDIVLDGNSERPYYGDEEIALLSDIKNQVEFDKGDTLYQIDTYIPYVIRPDETSANLVDSQELMAHATHDQQMFETLTAQIIAAEFTEEQITDIANAAIETASSTGILVTESELDSAVTTINNNLNQVIRNFNDGDAYTLEQAEEYANNIVGGAYQPDPNNGESVQVATSFFPTGDISNANNPIYGTNYVAQKTGFYFVRFDVKLSTGFGGRITSDLLISGNPVASNFFQAYNDPTQDQDTRLNFPMIYAEAGDPILIRANIVGSGPVTIEANSNSEVIYYPPRLIISPAATEIGFMPNYKVGENIQFTGFPSGTGSAAIYSAEYTVEKTGWYMFYYSALCTLNAPWSINVDYLVDGEIADINWFLTSNQINSAFVIPSKLLLIEEGSVFQMRVMCGGPGFAITPNGDASTILFFPPKAVVIPSADAVTYDEMMQAIAIPNIASHTLDWYTHALADGTLKDNDFIYIEDTRDPITNTMGVPMIIRTTEDSIPLATREDVLAAGESYTPLTKFTTHIDTDISRWENSYMTERRTIVQNFYAMGGMEDVANKRNIDVPTYTVVEDNGGIIDITTANSNGAYFTLSINGALSYSTEGIVDGASLNKSFSVNVGDVIQVTGENLLSVATLTPIVIDPNNPISILRSTMSQNIFNLQQEVLNINAARANKHLDTSQTQDVEAATQASSGWTVPANNGLGGQLVYEGIDFLLGSSGWVDVNGNRVYDYGGLLGLKIGTAKEARDVMDGDLIQTGGLNSIFYTPYIEGQS